MIPESTKHKIAVDGRSSASVYVISAFGADARHNSNAAVVYGDVVDGCLVRIHSRCMYSEVFASRECDCGWQLKRSRELLTISGGVLIYLDQEGRGAGLQTKAEAYRLNHEDGLDTYEAYDKLGVQLDQRDYYEAAQILKDLGLSQVRLMTNNPGKIATLEEQGIQVKRIPLRAVPTPTTMAYLEAKKRHGHLLLSVARLRTVT
jgi:3,4-dihydroxy 2-butanone 4-phosphate synthase/GTP cyclohydrolase II